MAPTPLPQFVYKIIPSPAPDPIPAEYPPSELDRKDGFIHLSTAKQIPITADLFFADATSVWIIKIRLARFAAATRWEGEDDGCAHLYGNFGAEDVEDVQRFDRTEGRSWAQEMGRPNWLE